MTKQKFLLMSSACLLGLTCVPSLILWIAHLNVKIPELPYQWSKDTSIEFLACPGTDSKDIEDALLNIKDLVDSRVKDVKVSNIDYCLCKDNMRPVTGTVEVLRGNPENEDYPTAAGRTESFWDLSGRVLSACVTLPDAADRRFDSATLRRITLHELIHVFGKDHAMIFYNEKTGSGMGDPLHIMYKSVCTTCRSTRNLSR